MDRDTTSADRPEDRAQTDESASGEGSGTRDADAGPTDPSDRIVSLDALRGFALLGILLVNVHYFALPRASYNTPTVYADFTGWNYLAWVGTHVFAELKFMTLFTILFGAGIVLFTESKARKGQSAIALHYRRTAWLLAFGLAHAYLLWYGDILVPYALCALWIVTARKWAPRAQVGAGLLLLAVPTVMYLVLSQVDLPSEVLAEFTPSAAAIQAEIDAYRGGWLDQMDHRVETSFQAQTDGFLSLTFWRVSGLMLIGMALFRLGVLSNERSRSFYRRMAAVGLGAGFPLIAAGLWYNHAHDWAPEHVLLVGYQFNYWGSLFVAGAYVAILMLHFRRRPDGILTQSLAAVGRTAFSNYLLQTVLATTIFYGHGLGLFASLERIELLGVVLLIWAVQVPLSVLWLRHFRYGPVEWVWRVLTYQRLQPFVREDRPRS